jgi:hypothetical protein
MSYKYSKGRALTLGTETITNQVSTGLLTASVIFAQSTILNRVSISSSYQLNYSHYFVGVNTLAATSSITLSLPNASGSISGRSYVIKDETGGAETNNIILNAISGNTIDGETSITIESPYASLNIYTDGSTKWFIY